MLPEESNWTHGDDPERPVVKIEVQTTEKLVEQNETPNSEKSVLWKLKTTVKWSGN